MAADHSIHALVSRLCTLTSKGKLLWARTGDTDQWVANVDCSRFVLMRDSKGLHFTVHNLTLSAGGDDKERLEWEIANISTPTARFDENASAVQPGFGIGRLWECVLAPPKAVNKAWQQLDAWEKK